MFTTIIALAALIGFLNILFIIYSSFASRRRLRKDQYTLVQVRAGRKKEVQPVHNESTEPQEMNQEYVVDGLIMYSKEDILSKRFSRVEGGHEPAPRPQTAAISRFSLADFK